MIRVTFKGYLKKYVRALSHTDTCGLYQLAKEAATDNPRLREPLLLYALFWGKEKVLLRATKDAKLRYEYENHLAIHNSETMMQELINGTSSLPERYTRVYQSYLTVRNKTVNENHTKLLMRNRILTLQQEKNVSTYRIYKDMKLNHGNLSAYIKHGDCQKVSLDKARKTLDYLEAYPITATINDTNP